MSKPNELQWAYVMGQIEIIRCESFGKLTPIAGVYYEGDGRKIGNCVTREAAEKMAAMLASAPKMLEALKEVLQECDELPPILESEIAALVEKIEGEEA